MPTRIVFRVYYIRPATNRTGSLGVHPDDVERVTAWKSRSGVVTSWQHVVHPTTGERLKAFRPIEGKLVASIESQGIQHGHLCQVEYHVVQRGCRTLMLFHSIRPA